MPLVSVVVPSFNHARYLPRRLASVSGQTLQDLEVILVDDASGDGSVEVARHHRDPRLVVLTSPVNSGSPFATWNRGIEAATGRYVWIAESDDAADPRFLEVLVGILEARPDVGLAYSQSSLVGADDEELGSNEPYQAFLHPARWKRDYFARGRDECRRFLVRMNTIPSASAVVFRRELALEVGLADPAFRLSGDHDLWVRMLLRSDLAYVAEPLAVFRRHGASVRSGTYADGTFLEESLRVAATICAAVDVPVEVRESLLQNHAWVWCDLVLGKQGSIPWSRTVRIVRGATLLDPGFVFRLAAMAASWLRRSVG